MSRDVIQMMVALIPLSVLFPELVMSAYNVIGKPSLRNNLDTHIL